MTFARKATLLRVLLSTPSVPHNNHVIVFCDAFIAARSHQWP